MHIAKTRFSADGYAADQPYEVPESLRELAAVVERWNQLGPPLEPRIIYRPVVYQLAPKGKTHTPALLFPFNLLAAGIDGLFVQLERFGGWVFRTFVRRVLIRLARFLHPPRQA